MWINLDQLLDLPDVTVVNYQKIDEVIFLKLRFLNETIECPNCHQVLDNINQTEFSLVRDLPIWGCPVYLEVPRRQFRCLNCQKYFTERLSFVRWRQHHTIRYESMIYKRLKNSSVKNICEEEGLDWQEAQGIFKELAKPLDQKIWNAPKRIKRIKKNNGGQRQRITAVIMEKPINGYLQLL